MRIDLTKFKGTSPQVAPHLLPEGGATVAKNCDLGYGDIRPLKGMSPGESVGLSGSIKSLYRYLDEFWFTALMDTDVVRGPIPDDTSGRVYYTVENSTPAFTFAEVATSGSIYPAVSYRIGVPAPSVPPIATIHGGEASEDMADERDRVYVYTFSNRFGEESAPSSASSIVTVSGTQTVSVAGMEAPPSGYYVEFRYKNIYRTDENGTYRYVSSVDAAESSFVDSVDDAALGGELISTDWNMPREDMQGLTFLSGGTLVGFSGKTVCFSVPNQPHAWPVAGEYVVHDDIVALGTFGSSVFVATTSYPVILTGPQYDAMNVERLEISQACTHKRGMVDAGSALLYPSPDGLVMVGSSSAQILTEKLVDRFQWQAMMDGFRFGAYYDNRYIGFTDTGGFIVDLSDGTIVDHDMVAYGGYLHEKTGELFLTKDNDNTIYKWNDGEVTAYEWKSGELLLPQPANFGFLQVVAESYPVTVDVYTEDSLLLTATIENQRAVRLPGGFRARKWQIGFRGTSRIMAAHIAQSGAELKQG
jgi:hypothetical protein